MNWLLRVLSIVLGLFLFPAISPAQEFTPIERLGDSIYNDKNLSKFQNQSCRTCHNPTSSFADPENMKDPFNQPVSLGSDGMSLGDRNTPMAGYGAFVPVFHFDTAEGIYVTLN